MPFHALFGLAGFFFGIVLYVYLFTILVKRRQKRDLELTLLFLIGGLLLWYVGNFLSLLLRQMDTASLAPLLGSLEGSAYLGLSLLPALLLHTHWAYYRRHYRLRGWEKLVFGFILLLLYVQLIFLPQALANFLRWPAVHPFEKLAPYAAPFLSLFALGYYASCYLQARILQQSIFVETPANPTNALVDIQACSELARRHSTSRRRVLVAVDNTFLGPLWQHPLKHGADLVLYSATKYIGGHSDVIAGVLLGSKELIERVRTLRSFLGTMAGPWTGWLILRSLETLKLRMTCQMKNARYVADYLADHPQVERVYYLGHLAEGNPQREIYRRQCQAPGP